MVTLPDAMWFCFFSVSVSRGFSSAALAVSPPAGEALSFAGEDMVVRNAVYDCYGNMRAQRKQGWRSGF